MEKVTVLFKNKKTIEALRVVETEEYFNNSNRRTLTFEIENTQNFQELNETVSEEDNVSVIKIFPVGKESMAGIYEGYVLKLKLSLEPVLVQQESSSSPAQYEERILLKLGKRTYIEEQLHNLGL